MMADTDTVDEAVKPRGKRRTAAEMAAAERALEKKAEDLAAREAALFELEQEQATKAEETPPARSRAKAERRQRRRRGSNDLTHQMKLGVGFKLDPNFEYRWINGGLDDQRLFDKTRCDQAGADWMPLTSDGVEVSTDEKSDSTGSVLRRAVGTNQAGQVEYAYLCRKEKELYDEDMGLIQAENDKRMQAIYRGRDPNASDKAPEGLGYGQELRMDGQATKAIKI